jgi:hypothetical protein
LRAQLSVHKDLQRQREGIRSAVNNTSTSTVHNNHHHNHRRVFFLDSNQETTSNDSQYDEQISNTTALPVIAPPAPFPFLHPGNQKASKQVRSRVQPKSKKPNQNLYSNQCACSPVDSNHEDLHHQRENRLQNSSAASSTTTTTTTNTSNATTPRAATSSCSASGESPFQTKPSLSRLNEKQKANSTKNELC